MSTILERRNAPRPGEGPFPYGWRDVRVDRPDGSFYFDQMPLTLEDVLHPEEGDHHVLTRAHTLDCTYLLAVVSARLADDRHTLVLSDTAVYWDEIELKHHCPDIAVIPGVRRREGEWRSFFVAQQGTRPALIIEVVSPGSRVVDVETKVEQYARAKVPRYVIADVSDPAGKRKVTLIDYRLGPAGEYEAQPLDANGRVWLDPPLGLWLGTTSDPEIDGDRLALFDPATGEEIGDYLQISRALGAETAARIEAEAQAREALARAESAEERIKQLEELLRRRNGAG